MLEVNTIYGHLGYHVIIIFFSLQSFFGLFDRKKETELLNIY